jgi:hypothetical protein
MLCCPDCGGELEDALDDDDPWFQYLCPLSCVECLRCMQLDEAVECPEEEDPGEA